MRDGLAVMGVEAKVTESFGPIVEEWLDGGQGKQGRLDKLCVRLGLKQASARSLRYQLLHRTVADSDTGSAYSRKAASRPAASAL